MRRSGFLIPLFLTLLTIGCATVSQDKMIDSGLKALNGKSIETAIGYLGWPDEEETIAGKKVYSWNNEKKGTNVTPHTNYNYGSIGLNTFSYSSTSYSTSSYHYACEVKIITNAENIILGSQFRGQYSACTRFANELETLAETYLAQNQEIEADEEDRPNQELIDKASEIDAKYLTPPIHEVTTRADKGDKLAARYAGLRLTRGQNAKQNKSKGINYLKKAVLLDDSYSIHELTKYYLMGPMDPQTLDLDSSWKPQGGEICKLARFLSENKKLDIIPAPDLILIANCLHSDSDSQSITLYKRAAEEAFSSSAAERLYFIYSNGELGAKPDLKQAAKWKEVYSDNLETERVYNQCLSYDFDKVPSNLRARCHSLLDVMSP